MRGSPTWGLVQPGCAGISCRGCDEAGTPSICTEACVTKGHVIKIVLINYVILAGRVPADLTGVIFYCMAPWAGFNVGNL